MKCARSFFGSTWPNTFRMPRTQFFSVVICDTSCARAISSARSAWQSWPLTSTSRYQPTRMIWARPKGIVGVGLVDLQRQCRLGVARIDADHRQALGLQTVIEPGRQLTGLEADALCMRRVLLQRFGDRIRCRGDFAAPDHLVVLVDHRDRCLGQRHIEADILA